MQENDIELWRYMQFVAKVGVIPAMYDQKNSPFSLKILQLPFEKSPWVLRTYIKSI